MPDMLVSEWEELVVDLRLRISRLFPRVSLMRLGQRREINIRDSLDVCRGGADLRLAGGHMTIDIRVGSGQALFGHVAQTRAKVQSYTDVLDVLGWLEVCCEGIRVWIEHCPCSHCSARGTVRGNVPCQKCNGTGYREPAT